jgi:murein DD-endopeptidase MepM/ murein hydrolase activator NlpD
MTTTASRIARLRTTTRRTLIAATALAATASLATSTAAQAAGPRPNFQLPVSCGQVWEASTYWTNPGAGAPTEKKHWPNLNSVDLAQRDADGNNLSEGEPALASADGVISAVYTTDPPKDAPELGGENRVFIDHGNGWTTYYIHLKTLPGLKVGQAVAQGERIGTVGKSGASSPHLHYTQLADGVAVRVVVNGQEIDTWEGDESTWGHYGDGEKLTSSNCPGREFLPFDEAGKHHLLAYTPGTGETGIASINAAATGIVNPWHATWNLRWTHFMPFEFDGEQRSIAYKASTGEVHYDRVGTNGTTNLATMTWSPGWTHLMPFTLGGQPYMVVYSSLTGDENVDRINASGNGSKTLPSVGWSKGWTHLEAFKFGGVQHMLAYRGSTGEVKINTITGSGDNVTFTNVYQGNWGTGWTHIKPVAHNGAVHVIRYKQGTGAVSFDRIAASAQGLVHLGDATWTKTWTVMSPFTQGNVGHVLVYKPSGLAKMLKLNAAGTGMIETYAQGWTLGLA